MKVSLERIRIIPAMGGMYEYTRTLINKLGELI